MAVFVLAIAAACSLLGAAAASDNCYDHQTETYDARFKPTYCTKTCTVTPFFSPDTSVVTYVNLIEAAQESIDIYAPGKLATYFNLCTLTVRIKHVKRLFINTIGCHLRRNLVTSHL